MTAISLEVREKMRAMKLTPTDRNRISGILRETGIELRAGKTAKPVLDAIETRILRIRNQRSRESGERLRGQVGRLAAAGRRVEEYLLVENALRARRRG